MEWFPQKKRRWRWPQGGDRPFQQSLRHRSLPVTASRFAESSSCFGYDGYESFNVRLFLHSVGQSLLDRTSCLGKSYIFRVFKEYWRWIWTKDFNPSFELFHMDGPILVTFMGTVQSWQSPMWAQRLCQMDVWHAECGRKRLTTGKWVGYTLFHCLIIMFAIQMAISAGVPWNTPCSDAAHQWYFMISYDIIWYHIHLYPITLW